MTGRRKWLKAAIIAAGIAAAGCICFVIFAGRFLAVSDNIGDADAIVVLSGESSGSREETGVRLYREGCANLIIMSGGLVGWRTTHASIMKEHAVYMGVPEENVVVEGRSETTYQNAVHTREIVKERGIHSILIVTSSYHMKRSLYIFRKVFRGTGVELYWCSSGVPYFTPSGWWRSDKGIKVVGMEYLKFIWYLLRY